MPEVAFCDFNQRKKGNITMSKTTNITEDFQGSFADDNFDDTKCRECSAILTEQYRDDRFYGDDLGHDTEKGTRTWQTSWICEACAEDDDLQDKWCRVYTEQCTEMGCNDEDCVGYAGDPTMIDETEAKQTFEQAKVVAKGLVEYLNDNHDDVPYAVKLDAIEFVVGKARWYAAGGDLSLYCALLDDSIRKVPTNWAIRQP